LRWSPRDKELWRRFGIVHWYAWDFAEAYASLTTAERYGLERNHVCHARGGVLAEWGLYDEAVDELTYAIDHAASRLAAAYARNGRAYALARLGEASRAEADWAASHDVAPANAWLRYLRGRIEDDGGDRESASRDYRLALCEESPRLVGPRREFVEERLRALGPTQ
jgi:tetratricopeptide (TPR) repeat protein